MRLASWLAWSETACRSYSTLPFNWMPRLFRCISSRISRTRPDADRSALLGTHPRFTQVPPMSAPSMIAVLSPLSTACSAAPWPPTPQPMITRS